MLLVTEQQALILIKGLVSAYPRQVLEEDTIKTYIHYLKDLEPEIAERVISHHIKTQKWFPTIAEIRESCAELVNEVPTTEYAMAVLREATRMANYRMVTMSDILIQAVDTVGWQKLMSCEHPEPLYRQIKDAYENLRKREIERLTALPAVGQAAVAAIRHTPKALKWVEDDE